jgi:hypothetical protein
MSTIIDMREHLMETLTALRNRENPMDVDRARAVARWPACWSTAQKSRLTTSRRPAPTATHCSFHR